LAFLSDSVPVVRTSGSSRWQN